VIPGQPGQPGHVRPLEAVVRLPDESTELLKRAPSTARGMTSVLFSNARFLLKLSNNSALMSQDACILRLLQRTNISVPHLVCATPNSILMENVGRPVTSANLPRDYRSQVSNILDKLHALGIRHNDLWKRWIFMRNSYEVELMVDHRERLFAVDFNTATSDTPLTCAKPLPREDTGTFSRSEDQMVLHLLDAMSRINQTIEAYHTDAGLRAYHGICDVRPMDVNGDASFNYMLGHVSQHGVCGHVDGQNASGAFALPGRNHGRNGISVPERKMSFRHLSGRPRSNTSGLPGLAVDASVQMPTLTDVQSCIQMCKACPQCAVISVSSYGKQCLWFDTSKGKPCEGGNGHAHELRTVHFGRALDDFVSVFVRHRGVVT